MIFKDVEFLSAKEKSLILKAWTTFLKFNFQGKHFTKRLYEFLHLNCGYIAHYDIYGFYATYFKSPISTEQFFERFERYVPHEDYADVNNAMKEVYHAYKKEILSSSEKGVDNVLNLLETSVEKAKKDKVFAKQFLSSLGM